MKKFKELREEVQSHFEAKRNNLSGSINDAKSVRHFKNYVAPYMSKEHIAKSEKEFGQHVTTGGFGSAHHGTHYNPEAEHTHTLETAHGPHPAGTKVKVTGGHLNDKGIIHLSTEKHGNIPQSKIAKPAELAKPAITKTGFDVEHQIAKNLGTKSAGSTKHAHDFTYGGNHKDAVKGKIKEVGEPVVRGESKLDRGKMGEATIKHTPEKGWHISERGNKEVGEHLKKAVHPESGMNVLEHLNKHHPEGHINKSVQFNAAPGTAQHYLKTSGSNVLHIHNKATNKGTTFTVGDKNNLKGKTNLGHLSHAGLEKFNGKIQVKPTTTGTSTMVHRPIESVMRAHANLSAEHPEKHKDLTQPKHAEEFKHHVNTHLGS